MHLFFFCFFSFFFFFFFFSVDLDISDVFREVFLAEMYDPAMGLSGGLDWVFSKDTPPAAGTSRPQAISIIANWYAKSRVGKRIEKEARVKKEY